MKSGQEYGIMFLRETLYSLLIYKIWARDQKEVTNMNKYELAVVVSAKIEVMREQPLLTSAKHWLRDSAATSQKWTSGARRSLLTKFRR